ncbi:sigma 54-interacting transcriptional regulator [Pseudodesulfovibrio sp. zrk46]|uniref:sigma 54-interacting transcriptional regulator n=1 Tax=Pseudodesulfovibrio sp. zrk46 TaxID=2725288 RepID=UPI001449FF4B|nr:sigma 54-interacting transcriptional regulator [Pseudodesulfovibrio sp. zrk46]QJB57513.1 sigma 54-interacting transcriptional regulator [Pseudodesulfovibrio sp. zrk46]
MPDYGALFFQKATNAIFKDLEGDAALSNIMNFLQKYMPVSVITLARYDADRNAVWCIAYAASDPDLTIDKYIYLQGNEERSLAIEEMRLDQAGIVNDFNDLPRIIKRIVSTFFPVMSSVIRIPLILNNTRLGSLNVHVEGINQYTEEDLKLLNLLREPFTLAIANIIRHQELQDLRKQLEDENQILKEEIHSSSEVQVIGAEFGLKEVMQQLMQVAPTDSTALLLGETGVGKELIANCIHLYSKRRDTPFIKVNCGAIPDSLIDSELFGHEKGAFTGAIKRKLGRFERAHRGTIFLDEIGELPMSAQTRLLRILQNREFERLGGTELIPVDTRIIAATNRDLSTMVNEGTFRKDLFFRLNVFPINIPPLRKRLSDLPELISYFIEKKHASLNLHRTFQLAPGALESMMHYSWPGNVRELENVVERELIRSNSQKNEKYIRFGETYPEPTHLAPNHTAPIYTLDQVMKHYITKILKKAEGRVEGKNGAAELLDIKPNTLRSRMRKLGIEFGRKVNI